MQKRDFIHVTEPEPHLRRTRAILAAHPEIRKLFGPHPMTAAWTALIVGLQFALALYLGLNDSPWWLVFALAYTVGATCSHALFVVIHEATHNLVFKGSNANRFFGMFANLPSVFPSALGFRKYHLLHHRYQGEFELDADLAGPTEAKIVGSTPVGKGLWLLFFWVIEGVVRPARLKKVNLLDRWTITNLAVQVAVCVALIQVAGWKAIAYQFLSLSFSIGLHPFGARWIQEHYVVKQGQETYSYYGPLNKLMFNVGYHNEHHDLMMVAWPRLPQVKAMAPEFYEPLHAHTSYVKLLLKFLFDPTLSLYSRVVRPDRALVVDRAPEKLSNEHASIANSPIAT